MALLASVVGGGCGVAVEAGKGEWEEIDVNIEKQLLEKGIKIFNSHIHRTGMHPILSFE